MKSFFSTESKIALDLSKKPSMEMLEELLTESNVEFAVNALTQIVKSIADNKIELPIDTEILVRTINTLPFNEEKLDASKILQSKKMRNDFIAWLHEQVALAEVSKDKKISNNPVGYILKLFAKDEIYKNYVAAIKAEEPTQAYDPLAAYSLHIALFQPKSKSVLTKPTVQMLGKYITNRVQIAAASLELLDLRAVCEDVLAVIEKKFINKEKAVEKLNETIELIEERAESEKEYLPPRVKR